MHAGVERRREPSAAQLHISFAPADRIAGDRGDDEQGQGLISS